MAPRVGIRKYQVVIPQGAREALGLEVGDELLVQERSRRHDAQAEEVLSTRRGPASRGLGGARAYLKDERGSW